MQNAKAPMYIALVVNVVNVIISYVLVYYFGHLSDGVAWGTLIAQYLGLLLAVAFVLYSYRDLLKTKIQEHFLDWKELKIFMKVNTDIMIRSVTLIFTISFFTAVSSEFGDTILGVNALLLQFLMFFAYFTDGLAYAAESLSGKYIGAKDWNGFRIMRISVFKVAWVMSLVFTLLYALFGKSILSLLTTIPEILASSEDYLFWLALIPLTSIAAFVYDGIFIGALASRPMRNTLLIATFLVFLPTYNLLRSFIGNHSLWLALNLFMIARSIGMWYFSNTLLGKTKRL
jgi:MATE family multidrug resistance protein